MPARTRPPPQPKLRCRRTPIRNLTGRCERARASANRNTTSHRTRLTILTEPISGIPTAFTRTRAPSILSTLAKGIGEKRCPRQRRFRTARVARFRSSAITPFQANDERHLTGCSFAYEQMLKAATIHWNFQLSAVATRSMPHRNQSSMAFDVLPFFALFLYQDNSQGAQSWNVRQHTKQVLYTIIYSQTRERQIDRKIRRCRRRYKRLLSVSYFQYLCS